MNRYIKYGLILSVLSLGLFLLVYFLDTSQIFTSWYFWSGMILMAVVTSYAMMEERKEKDGILDYGDRFKTCLFILLISTFFMFIVQMIIYKTDQSFRDQVLENQINTSLGMTKFINKFQEDLNKYDIEEMKIDMNNQFAGSQMNDPYSGTMLMATSFNVLIFALLLAFMLAFFVGREKLTFRERIRRIDL